MKSALTLLTCTLFFVFSAYSQVAIQNQVDPKEYRPYEIKIKKNFRNDSEFFFELTDNRTDTTRLGFMKDNFKQIYFYFNRPAVPYLSSKINTNKIYGDTIGISLNKLWVYESLVPRKRSRNNPDKSQGDILFCYGRIAADIFTKKDGRQVKLFSYDSTINTRGYMANNVDYLILKNMNILLQMADSITSAASKAAANTNELFIPETTRPAILAAPNFKDGIYLRFEDFLNNTPANISFKYEIKKKRESMKLNEASSDDSLYTKYNWGFCIHGQPYMRIGGSFSKLTKIENSFELRAVDLARFYVSKEPTFGDGVTVGLVAGLAGPGAGLSEIFQMLAANDKYFARYENISAFKLDLKTGELY